jgi:trypsin
VVSGWGQYSDQTSGILRAATVPLAELQTCRQHASAMIRNSLTEITICSVDEKRDACQGDSGGPLVIGPRRAPQTIGIVSFGLEAGCGVPSQSGRLVGAYTRASILVSFIEAAMKESKESGALVKKAPGELMTVDDGYGRFW